MKNELTKKQGQILQFIGRYLESHGFPPTILEIGAAFHITVGAVQDHLAALKRKGHLTQQAGKARGFGLSRQPDQVMIYGRVVAGNPLLSEENIEGTLDGVSCLGRDIFALRVFGDSMTGAGIREGDFVIVKKQSSADNGDIVVALVDGEATVRRYRIRKGRKRLEPENPNYHAVERHDFEIIGKVTELRRMYR